MDEVLLFLSIKKKLRIKEPPLLVFKKHKKPLGFMKDLVDSKQLLDL
jgi:hypothetical protein